MANDYFQFKQFRIQQNQCAMKVCTDSCLLGAYARVEKAGYILDIGAGTGLLALMAAQRSQAWITAVEIDAAAAAQAQENIAASPWATRVLLRQQSLQDFEESNTRLFDLILCNPPFYQASHKSPDPARNVAMHSHALSFAEIIRFCKRFLQREGLLYMLLPPAESRIFESLAAESGLFAREKLHIHTRTGGKHLRTIQVLGHQAPALVTESQLDIRQADHSYTEAFRELLREYYLIF
ncbi:MAG: tRNA1(Val) (adenine(37)-N6)-methyltransferase [Adhaeribacter sp.]